MRARAILGSRSEGCNSSLKFWEARMAAFPAKHEIELHGYVREGVEKMRGSYGL